MTTSQNGAHTSHGCRTSRSSRISSFRALSFQSSIILFLPNHSPSVAAQRSTSCISKPAARYSEDIDLVQINAEPAGPIMSALRDVLDPRLGRPQWKQSEGRITFVYRFDSEDAPPLRLRLKVEINSREHFSVYGVTGFPFSVSSRWFSGESEISTYILDELLGTKMRALYQRKKSRDLFDLAVALDSGPVDPDRAIAVFLRYMEHGGHRVSRAEFERNIEAKLCDQQFTGDIGPLLATGFEWDSASAAARVRSHLIERLPGAPWQEEGRERASDREG